MKRRGCKSCHLLEPVAGQWRDGLCPNCQPLKAALPQPQPSDATVDRLRGYLASIAREFPDCWKAFDNFRAMRGGQLPAWPNWCFCPVSGAYAIASGGGDNRVPIERMGAVASLACLGAWRPAQGIYRFDATVLEALWDTPVTGEIPGEVLHAIPEWCVYVETPGRTWATRPMFGFFAFLESDAGGGREELRLVVDDGDRLTGALPIHLGAGLEAGLRRAHAEALRQIELRGEAPESIGRLLDEQGAEIMRDIAPLVSAVLYLCSQNGEIAGRGKPCRPRATRTKRGDRLFPPDQPRVWECGYRIGAAIRAAQEQERRPAGDGTHASPRPHIRRAHWHSFWTGPKAKVGATRETDRKLVLRWLPPIAVNVSEEAEVVPTVHPVR